MTSPILDPRSSIDSRFTSGDSLPACGWLGRIWRIGIRLCQWFGIWHLYCSRTLDKTCTLAFETVLAFVLASANQVGFDTIHTATKCTLTSSELPWAASVGDDINEGSSVDGSAQRVTGTLERQLARDEHKPLLPPSPYRGFTVCYL